MIIFVLLIVALSMGAWMIFKDSLNLVQGFGPVYWITRDVVPTNTRLVSTGFMHELCAPWRVGKGVQIRLGHTRTFQIGFCKRTRPVDEESGVLQAVGGRMMDEVTPEDIGEW